MAKEELTKIPEIDLILGINEKNEIVKYINEALSHANKENILQVSGVENQQEFLDFGTVTHTETTRAVIKVQDGCNQFCSYCIIPYARGRIRSRKPQSVLQEIQKISQEGIKEVVITGIHVASYGKDFTEETLAEINQALGQAKQEYYLIDLLEDIQKIQGIERIRLGSLEPTLITEAFTERLVKLNKICDHFHLSLQSGCNATLKRMNRKYTTEQFEKVAQLLRQAFSNVHLTTDIIVGFPGETEEEFETTYDFLKKIQFYKMHVFQYSPRKGTVASTMPNQIEGNIKEERSKKLIQLSNGNQKAYHEVYLGKQVQVLFEEQQDGYIKGHTTNYMVVKIQTQKNLANTIQMVKIVDSNEAELVGELQ